MSTVARILVFFSTKLSTLSRILVFSQLSCQAFREFLSRSQLTDVLIANMEKMLAKAIPDAVAKAIPDALDEVEMRLFFKSLGIADNRSIWRKDESLTLKGVMKPRRVRQRKQQQQCCKLQEGN